MGKDAPELYRYDPDTDHFESVEVGPELDQVLPLHFGSVSVASRWKPIRVTVSSTRRRRGDFPTLSEYGRIPVCSEKAVDTLAGFLGSDVEALPIHHPRGKYYLLNVLQVIDCIDERRSILARNSATGRVSSIRTYSLREGRTDGKHLFKTPLKSGAELLLDGHFRRLVERAGLKGLRFKAIHVAGE